MSEPNSPEREHFQKERKKAQKEKEKALREKEKEKEQIALTFHKKGVDLQTISESTGIPLERLELIVRPKAS